MKIFVRSLEKSFLETLYTYFTHQWMANKGVAVLYPDSLCYDMTKDINLIVRYNLIKDRLDMSPWFQGLEKQLLMNICRKMSVVHVPPGQVMAYAGEVPTETYIIGEKCYITYT